MISVTVIYIFTLYTRFKILFCIILAIFRIITKTAVHKEIVNAPPGEIISKKKYGGYWVDV